MRCLPTVGCCNWLLPFMPQWTLPPFKPEGKPNLPSLVLSYQKCGNSHMEILVTCQLFSEAHMWEALISPNRIHQHLWPAMIPVPPSRCRWLAYLLPFICSPTRCYTSQSPGRQRCQGQQTVSAQITAPNTHLSCGFL